ncbi:hypothetical protein N9991_00275 [bacterium]|jgi:hypothetical protein|nr:hypothetical protein [bacterium]
MAFIVENSNTISFAEFTDVTARDQRLFDNNESLTLDFVEDALERTTSRLLENIKTTEWWQRSYGTHNGSVNRLDIPPPDADRIKSRQTDFTDLCVYRALADYILPAVADFGDPENAERQKMGYYENRATQLYLELVNSGDWYDFDDDGTVQTDEKSRGYMSLKRVR